jgi:hypothetical protein
LLSRPRLDCILFSFANWKIVPFLGQRITRSCCFIASITRPSIQSNKVGWRRVESCLLVTVAAAPAAFCFLLHIACYGN